MDEFAKKRSVVSKTLPALRGTIYDKNDNVLALNVTSYTVIAYLEESRTIDKNKPEHVTDINYTALKLGEALDIDVEELKKILSKDLYQVELGPKAKGITELKKAEIEALNLPGIDFVESQKRYYPNGNFASYIIGYAKNDEFGKIIGELGIEANYNEELKGTSGKIVYQQDRNGYQIPDTQVEKKEPINGNDIYLTIDSNIQRFVEATVKETTEQYNPEWMMVGVMEAKTGKILGVTTTPSFDPNIRDIKIYENTLVSYAYEPGSTMKTFTYMCAMENGTYNGNETFASGKITVKDSVISDWNGYGWGAITYDKGLEYSSNVGIVNIVQKQLNKDKLLECFQKYGFGKKTGIELSREVAGELKFNYEIEVTNAGFGQGITTTAIQHLQSLSILANNGKMITPSIIEKIVNPNSNEEVYKWEKKSTDQIVTSSTVKKINQLLYNAVNNTDEGTAAKSYKLDEVTLIGKTGTAQIFDNKLNRYLTGDSNYIFSFAGMFPDDDPEIIIYSALKQPKGGTSRVLANATKEIVKNIAKYKGMYGEDQIEKLKKYTVKSYYNQKVDDVVASLTKKNINTIVLGTGDVVIGQYPSIETLILEQEYVILKTNGQSKQMTNFKGLSRTEANTICELLNLKCTFNGYGYVDTQSVVEGNQMDDKTTIIFELVEKYNLTEEKEE